jgi:hypothetical protein
MTLEFVTPRTAHGLRVSLDFACFPPFLVCSEAAARQFPCGSYLQSP